MSEELTGKKILIVDDEELIRELLTDILEDHGAQVLHAEDGEEGEKVFFENEAEIDFLILDLLMPNKDGMQVYHSIREKNTDIKILFCSGYTASDPVSEVLSKDDRLGFLNKPYREQEILDQLLA